MCEPGFIFTIIARLCARRHPAASGRATRIGDTMSSHIATSPSPARRRPRGRVAAALIAFVVPTVLAVVPLVGAGSAEALACACGCSVFDVGGLDSPQEQDHGGRIFFEFWSGDQTQNYIGSSHAPSSRAIPTRTSIPNGTMSALEYMFNRQWGVMVRVPTTDRTLTTETDAAFPGQIQSFNSRSIGDIEVMGIYTGFFSDMSTGLELGLKLPSGHL